MDIEVSIEDHVLQIVLNRPTKSNAFTLDMIDEWAKALIAAKDNEDIRAVMLVAEGKNFCAGADFSVLADTTTALERKLRLTEHIHRIPLALEDLDKPVVAAVNGAATGAGMDMALMCDFRIAGTSARFAETYIRVGLVPGDGGAYYLPRLVGPSKAMEILMTGDFIDSAEALRLGLVNRVVPDDELRAATSEFAHRLAEAPPINVRLIKRAVQQSSRADLRTSLDLISSHMAVVQTTSDSREALSAFREKRTPNFIGS